MRYWVKLAGKLRGPLEAEEVVNLPGIEPHTLLCPEGMETRNRKNWRFARHFPDVRARIGQAKEGAPAAVDWSDDRAPGPVDPPPAAFEDPPEEEFRPVPLAEAEPGRSGWTLIAVAAAVFAFLAYRTPAFRQAVERAKPLLPVKGWQAAAEVVLPSCGRTLQDASGGGVPMVTPGGGNKYTLSWGPLDASSSEGVVMEYDETRKQIRPLTETARKVLDFREPCRKR